MTVDVYNRENKKVGTAELPDRIFKAPWKPDLVHQVLTAQMATRRQPLAHAKDRSEVRGGGRKPWRQKGTGRARHGSIRSPLWRGGGKAHGPRKEKDYTQKVTRKMRQIALFSVLSKKIADKEVKIFDDWNIREPKTKMLARELRSLLEMSKKDKKYDVVLIPDAASENLSRAAANLPKARVLSPKTMNLYDILSHKRLFIDQKAIPVIDAHYTVSPKVKAS